MPAIVDRGFREKVTKGASWNKMASVVEKVWDDTGGNRSEMMSIKKFGRYKTEVQENI